MKKTNTNLQYFEMMLNGYYGNTDDTDGLVKWVAAPSQRAIRLFIQKNDLQDIVQNGPHDMNEHHLSFDEGLDLIINERGDVIRWRKGLNVNWRRTWGEEAWPEKFNEDAYSTAEVALKTHKRLCKRYGRRRSR